METQVLVVVQFYFVLILGIKRIVKGMPFKMTDGVLYISFEDVVISCQLIKYFCSFLVYLTIPQLKHVLLKISGKLSKILWEF